MKLQQVRDGYYVILERGDKLIETLTKVAREKEIPSAVVTGLGAVTGSSLGYYELEKKEYIRKEFPEELEVAGLNGNITWFEGNPVPHIHVVLSDHHFHAFGGHLFETHCAATVELFLRVEDVRVERKYNCDIGLNLQGFE